MADTKITGLQPPQPGYAIVPSTDVLPIVVIADPGMAASGSTRKATVNQILGAGGTATLASATITGDLTVRTNKLAVTSTGVGINYTSPAVALHLGTTGATNKFCINTAFTSGGDIQMRRGSFIGFSNAADSANSEYIFANGGVLDFGINGTTAMTIDASRNVGVGVTPSAWGAGYKAIQIASSQSTALMGSGNQTELTTNAFFDSAWKYQGAGTVAASRYSQQSGVHYWYTAAAGAANATITDFATAKMTLDASGNLLVGTTTTQGGWATKLTISSDSGTTKWAVGPYSVGTNFVIAAQNSYGVYLNGTTATSWTGVSDERLKDIIEPISNAVAKVGQLRSVIGKFKSDETNTRRSFLIAQDIQAVLPEAVDASNPDRLGVAYTDVIPLLVAAIKELTARVEALEA